MAFKPGQYATVLADIHGEQQRRNYSLSSAPNGETYRISVKREAGGKMSNHLHDHVNVGDTVDLFPPAGDFVLQDSDKPVVLISGGVGITPTLAMLGAALRSQRPVHFIHAARNPGVHAFRGHVDHLAGVYPQLRRHYVHENNEAGQAHAGGFLSKEQLAQWLPENRDVEAYFLGPKAFMKAVKTHLRELGVPETQTYYEFFGPAEALQ
jgi:nitric oxide dioxygenase